MSVRKQEPELRKFLIIALLKIEYKHYMKDYNDVGGIPPFLLKQVAESQYKIAIKILKNYF